MQEIQAQIDSLRLAFSADTHFLTTCGHSTGFAIYAFPWIRSEFAAIIFVIQI
jgi:hypothetical protein